MESLDELAARLHASSASRMRAVQAEVMGKATKGLEAGARANIDARLEPHTRQLRSSVRSAVQVDDDVVVGIVAVGGEYQGLTVPYARLQEYGGTVLPVKGKYLAIPVAQGLTAAGTARYPSVRMMPFAVFVAGRPGGKARWLVFDKRNHELFFVLVDSSTIPAQRYLRDALDDAYRLLPGQLAEAAAGAVLGDA